MNAVAVTPWISTEHATTSVQIRMGQTNVKRWIGALMPLVLDEADPLGVDDLATHRLPLEQGPDAYAMFQDKRDGAIKVVLRP